MTIGHSLMLLAMPWTMITAGWLGARGMPEHDKEMQSGPRDILSVLHVPV